MGLLARSLSVSSAPSATDTVPNDPARSAGTTAFLPLVTSKLGKSAARACTLAPSAIAVVVESIQYHGQEFYCSGRTSDGTELYFISKHRIAKGDTAKLSAAPNRVLVYAGGQ